METAYQSAMAPNPWEARVYNIINDAGADPFIRNFDSQEVAAFWAPVFPPGKDRKTVSDDLKAEIDTFFSAEVKGNTGASRNPLQNVKDTLLTGLDRYINNALPSGAGEEVGTSGASDGANIVRISNPLVKRNADGSFAPITGSETTVLRDPTVFKSSWNTVNDGKMREAGRVGYSVKFISFAALTDKKLTTDGQTSWGNVMNLDGDAELDVPFIKH